MTETNYTLKFTSDSADEQTLGLIIFAVNIDFDNIPSHGAYEFPFFNYFSGYGDIFNYPDTSFYYDSDSKKDYLAIYLFMALLILYSLILTIVDRKYIRMSVLSLYCCKNNNN